MNTGKCLIITHPARLGDSVMSLPLHRALAQVGSTDSNVGEPYRFLFEEAGITVGQAGPLYPKRLSEVIAQGRQLRECRYDTVFLVRPNFRSALLARIARIPNRVGDATEGRRPLLTFPVLVPANANQLDRLEAFGRAVGIEVPRNFGLPPHAPVHPPVVGISPGASYGDKLIPAEALRAVAERLVMAGYEIALVGAPGQEPWNAPLADLAKYDWVGTFSLPDLLKPLGTLSALIASDGGLYHLAVGCGVPSVGVYGPTAHRNWSHDWGKHVPVIARDGKMANVSGDHLWNAVTQAMSKVDA